jgi:hypothetical protein
MVIIRIECQYQFKINNLGKHEGIDDGVGDGIE